MTPTIARFSVFVFLVISCGISINALFLQNVRQEVRLAYHEKLQAGQNVVVHIGQADESNSSAKQAPINQNREVPYVASVKKEITLDAKIRDVLGEHSDAAEDDTAADDVVRTIQEGLAQLGYHPGTPDGIAGPTTRAAIMAYEFDRKLVQTGIADTEILAVIRGHKARPNRKINTNALVKNSEELVSALQKALTRLGYDTGGADGKIGPLTRKRIRSFERDNKLDVTGRISGRLIDAIHKVSGRTLLLARLN